MTERVYRTDAHMRAVQAVAERSGPEGVVLDRTVLYARSGGQPGDAGVLRWARGEAPVAEALKGEGEVVVHPIAGEPPAPGDAVTVTLDVSDSLVVEVVDDGGGIDPESPRSGLRSLEERARRRNGEFSVVPLESGGTCLRWHAPLHA